MNRNALRAIIKRKMNCVKYAFVGLLLLCSTSCNQERIDELEAEVWKLEKQNQALQEHIDELEMVISRYESACAEYSAQQSKRDWHKQIAEQHIRTAEFWRQSGNEFMYESHMQNAQNELDMIP